MKRLTLLLLPFVAACANFPDLKSYVPDAKLSDIKFSDIKSYFTPYRIDVRQGNFVTQEMVAQLKAGQTKDQVRFILGTPLLTDVFHADRWDYVYRFQPGHGEATQRRIVVYFADGKLARIAGDVVTNALANAAANGPSAGQEQVQPQLLDKAQPAAQGAK